jgi:predicted enzyme related to lactoylglutathione lyase
MTLSAIYAQLSCSDLKKSSEWFSAVFDRKPDATPMAGLAEWHHKQSAGFQLFQDRKNAGKGTLTLIVNDIESEQARLTGAGLKPGEIEPADYTTIARLRDPDGNLVVLAQPKNA